jgi:hypothetical protein
MKKNNNFLLTSVAANNLQIGLFRYSIKPDKKFLSFNKTFLDLTGHSQITLLGKDFDILFSSQSDKSIFFKLLNRGGPVRLFHTKPLVGGIGCYCL